MRIILYTGKGGVGKTSVAAATACHIASQNQKVLIMSTDPAHSLKDSFEMKIGKEPTKVKENLYACEIDVVEESEKAWSKLKEYMKKLITSKSEDLIEAEELLCFPGLEELFSLLKLIDLCKANEYDVILVDCAPTGETLSLLKFPEKFGDFVRKVLPSKKKAVKYVGPVVEKTMKVPMPEISVFDEIEHLTERLGELQTIMSDQNIVTIRVVTTPEKIVIREAKRNFACMHLYGYQVDAIIVNRIYPEAAMKGYFSKWLKMQQEGLEEIQLGFADIPKFYLELQRTEIKSLKQLEAIGGLIYGDVNPEEILYQGKVYELCKENDDSVLKLYVPGLEKQDFSLEQKGNEVYVSIHNEQHSFYLPDQLRNHDISGAKYEEGVLKIRFSEN